ncbi:hypothetical protein C4544_02010 [candidate division WS5 bacterium]|uniref:CD-NTase-associated protein 12/Pycsar effector protein TIR domain-containing protein n=1 Tax=candidate division WS5 bacterium TaxID=2093353 RepID=A0A419DF18_9BACT|nr:MAG: hypothetical protein C4544_02010 [candidate division WS5 bacterium]
MLRKKTTNAKGKCIFVVHGRNIKLRKAMFDFLKAIGLEPMDWDTLRKLTGQGAPTTLDVVRTGMSKAYAILVIWSPEERVHLLPSFWGTHTRNSDRKYYNQPRPNVILEAGMAISLKPDKVIFVHLGEVRDVSDLDGLNVIKWDNDLIDRNALMRSLESIGCNVQLSDDSWKSVGNFMNYRTVPRSKIPSVLRLSNSAPCYGLWFAYQGDFHCSGNPARDAQATKGWMWLCAADRGHAVYGPYHQLSAGKYEAWFRVHVKNGNACLDVFNQKKSICELVISENVNYELFCLPFVLLEKTYVEFRVAHTFGSVTATDFSAVMRIP